MWDSIAEFFNTIGGRFASPHLIIDLIDIAIVAYLIYKVLQLAVQTRAEQLLKGITIVLILYAVASWLKMVALSFIMNTLLQVGILAVVVLFQPEIRRALEQIGRSKVGSGLHLFDRANLIEIENAKIGHAADQVCRAVTELSLAKTGALIVFERKTKLGEVIATGTVIDATVTVEMIGTIFFPKTPLHDGAMIIKKNRICAAGCFLPLSQNFEISRELGTRHRAALGLSEVSDAVVIVVSEETGKISMVEDGQMLRGLSAEELKTRLISALETPVSKAKERESVFRQRFGGKK